MPATDKQGRPYAKFSDLAVGVKLECDGGFTCMKKGEVKTVKREGSDFFVSCAGNGRMHYLLPDRSDGGLVGFYLVTEQ